MIQPGNRKSANCALAGLFAFASICTPQMTAQDSAPAPKRAEVIVSQPPVNVVIQNQIDTSAGVNGQMKLAMSTAFQAASWSYQFFDNDAKANNLNALNPALTHFQVCCDGIPLQGSTETGATWDFTIADTLLAPVWQNVPDHNPEYVIANAPPYMTSDTTCGGCGYILPPYYDKFADISAKLVSYYNGNGFDAGGKHYQKTNTDIGRIQYWGVYNEPDGNSLSLTDYASLYNKTAPKMLAADPTIKLVAGELAYSDQGIYDQRTFQNAITAHVDAFAVHVYSGCDPKTTDQALFNTIPYEYSAVRDIYTAMQGNVTWANIPLWVTENNFDSDYPNSSGASSCTGNPFVVDKRGTSGFFPAWRFGMFINLGKAGVQLLNHWLYNVTGVIEPQYSEVTTDTGDRYRSYWTDFYLANWVPAGQEILVSSSSDPANSDILAVRSLDNQTVTILMDNRKVRSSADVNGSGVTRTFSLDLSALGPIASATFVTIDSRTTTAPTPRKLLPSQQMNVSLNGYGAAILKLVLPSATVHRQ